MSETTAETKMWIRRYWDVLLFAILLLLAVLALRITPQKTRLVNSIRYFPLSLLILPVIMRASMRGAAWEKRQKAQELERIQLEKERELERMRLDVEVEGAKSQMEELFPAEGAFERPGISLAHRRIQATTISGDFYTFITRGDGSLGIYFVDVEGHGLSASNQVLALYQIVNTADWGMGNARKEMEQMDDLVSRSAIFQKEDTALCMNFTEVDPEKMEIRHANAGMPFPLLFRRGEAQPRILTAAEVYVGAGYSRYPVKPEQAEMQAEDGDILVIVSDGILEAKDSNGRIFGQMGIIAAVTRTRDESPESIADEIIQSVRRHSGAGNPEDDQTLVVVQIGNIDAGPVQAKTLEMENGVFRLMNTRDTVAASHDDLRKPLKVWVSDHGFQEERIDQIWGSTWEAIQNAIKYGSRPGDVILIELIPPGKEEKSIGIRIRQPLLWEDWDKYLGDRIKKKAQTGEILMGGNITMLRGADRIEVSELGRVITMWFSPEVVPDPKISPSVAEA